MNCILCGCAEGEYLPELTRIVRSPLAERILRCSGCGLAFLDPMPAQDQLQAFYSAGAFAGLYKPSDYVAGHVTALPHIDERLRRIEVVVGGPGRILDIGAAHGAFLKSARDRGWAIEGVELDLAAASLAKESHGIDLQTRPLEQIGFADGSFDAVHMSHVLEHLLRPDETIRLIRQLLRPGGVLFIEVPHEFGDLLMKLRRTILRRPIPPYEVPAPHTYFFTPGTLKRLVCENGLKVVAVSTPRRNRSLESSLPFGSLVKRGIYALEGALLEGPLLELLSVKPAR